MNKIFYFLSFVLFFSSCVDLEYDQPPTCCDDVELETNINISEIKAMFPGGEPMEITDDLVFDAVVAADDESGNFYKGLIIQDETGAIELRMDQINLYSIYPEGRKIFVKMNGLLLGTFNGNLQIGHSINEEGDMVGIASTMLDTFVVRGSVDNEIEIFDANLGNLTANLQNQPIRLSGVEFEDPSGTYADAINFLRGFEIIQDCNENQIELVTSGYADFAGDELPDGNGEIVAIYSLYNGSPQLLLRSTEDVVMLEARCDGGGTGGDPCIASIELTPVSTLDEDLNDQSADQAIDLDGWANIACAGDRTWLAKEFDGNIYAQATSFNSSSNEDIMYLISRNLEFSSSSYLQFESAQAFYEHDGLTAMISTDFTESQDVTKATWIELNAKIAGSSDDFHTWVDSGVISLSDYAGKEGVIAFKYEGTSASNTTSYRIDNVVVGN